MISKSLKFTIVTIFVLVLIAAYFGVGMFVVPSTQANNNGSVIDDPLEGLPDEDDEDQSIGGTEEDDEIILPVDPHSLVNYSLDKLYSSVGYKGEIKINSLIKGGWGSNTGLTLPQQAIGNIESCGGESLEELYFYYDENAVSPLLVKLGAVMNYYRAVNIINTDSSINSFYVMTYSSNAKEQTYNLHSNSFFEALTQEQVLQKVHILYSLPLNIKLTSANSYCSGYPSETKLYKTVQIKLYNSAITNDILAYYNAFTSYIPVLEPEMFKSLTYTFVINKKTGELERMMIQHDIQGIVSIMGLRVDFSALVNYQIDYEIYDEPFEVQKPYLKSQKYKQYINNLKKDVVYVKKENE